MKVCRRIPERDSVLLGVCGGMAYYFEDRVLLIMFLWACVIAWLNFWGVVLYAIVGAIMPEWEKVPSDFEEVTGGYPFKKLRGG